MMFGMQHFIGITEQGLFWNLNVLTSSFCDWKQQASICIIPGKFVHSFIHSHWNVTLFPFFCGLSLDLHVFYFLFNFILGIVTRQVWLFTGTRRYTWAGGEGWRGCRRRSAGFLQPVAGLTLEKLDWMK